MARPPASRASWQAWQGHWGCCKLALASGLTQGPSVAVWSHQVSAPGLFYVNTTLSGVLTGHECL